MACENTRTVLLVANGDLRLAANQTCWAAQAKMEKALARVLKKNGFSLERAHPFDPAKGHGFIDSQKLGLEVFRRIPVDKPLIVAEAVWQYSQHILPGLWSHRGPILTVANWSGRWPGLVGLLNLNASLTKAGVKYSSLWSETFEDEFFSASLHDWLLLGNVQHSQSHVRDFDRVRIPRLESALAHEFAARFKLRKALLGVFDEGCMGMFNAIIPDELLQPLGLFKERLSQSSLYAEMRQVSDRDAGDVYKWLLKRGMRFEFGPDEETDLTENQVIEQCRMYVAALRIADSFGCSAIGIQYQQGLKDLTPASDLVEGLLNNAHRPPVRSSSGQVLFEGEALPHFNEVDECAGVDGLITYQLWRQLGLAPENTLHDLRWGQEISWRAGAKYRKDFVWVLLISGAAPPAHFIGGYRGATSERQPPMYFRLGGGTLKGISKPGHIVWSRIFIMNGSLHCDLGVAEVVSLPLEETERRRRETTPQWPIMHAVFKGVSRDQMMARHKSNHIQVAYAPTLKKAFQACRIKAAVMAALGIRTHFCGDVDGVV